jgi:hypothetical protein
MSCISIPPLRDNVFRELDVLYYLIVASSVPNWVLAVGELDFAWRRGRVCKKPANGRDDDLENRRKNCERPCAAQLSSIFARSGEVCFG